MGFHKKPEPTITVLQLEPPVTVTRETRVKLDLQGTMSGYSSTTTRRTTTLRALRAFVAAMTDAGFTEYAEVEVYTLVLMAKRET